MAHSASNEPQKNPRCGGTHLSPTPRKALGWFTRHGGVGPVFLLHSLTACLSEIPQRFSSSSLPPEFAAGRCAAIFIPALAVP
jgi:hypothetical protein